MFVRFANSESPKLVPWRAHTASIISLDAPAPVTAHELVVWQLVSANNRELARGFGVHASFDLARASAAHVVAAEGTLVAELVNESARGVYGWYASLGGVPAVTCARWYVSDRDRRQSMNLALASLPLASLTAGARLAHPELMAGGRTDAR